MIDLNWIKIKDERPVKDGSYMTLWSNPYQKTGSLDIQYFHNGRTSNEIAGANEILYWCELPDMPEGFWEYREEMINKRIKD